MYNKKGVSAIIINTKKGKNIFDKIKKEITYKNCKLEEIVAGNPSLEKSGKKNKKREKFFSDLDNLTINELVKKYIPKTPLWRKILGKIKRIIKKFFKSY